MKLFVNPQGDTASHPDAFPSMGGNRDPAKRADYILYYKTNIPLAVVGAKDNDHSVGAGMQSA